MQRSQRQRIGRARKPQQLRHVALHAGAVDQHEPQRDPIEVELGQPLLRRQLGAAVGLGRLRRQILGEDVLGGRPRLRADRGQKDETLDARALGRARECDRGLGVEHAIIVLGQSGHGVGDAGRMNDGVSVGERRGHVLRPGEVADDSARALHRHDARAPQQHAQPVAALGQVAQQALPDEAGRSGKGDQRFGADRVHRGSRPFD